MLLLYQVCKHDGASTHGRKFLTHAVERAALPVSIGGVERAGLHVLQGFHSGQTDLSEKHNEYLAV